MRTIALLLPFSLLLASCAQDEGAYATRGLRETDRTVGQPTPTTQNADRAASVAAYVNGRGVSWDELNERMAERVGGAVLQEVALERLLDEACARAGVTIREDDLADERELLLRTLEDDGVARNDASRSELLGEVLRRRGLGEAGFRSLLRRTAMSRALVRDEVVLSEDAVRRAYDLRYGPSYEARLIVTENASRAGDARQRLLLGEPIGDVAARYSTDTSALAGGRIPPINPADLSWPASVREAVRTTPVGTPTALVAIEGGYAVLVVERVVTPPSLGISEEERLRIARRDARLEAERLLMARLARDLLGNADVKIQSRALERSWGASRTP